MGAFPLTGKNRLFILLPVTSSLKDLQAVEEKMTDTVLREVAKDMAKVTPTVAEVTLPKLKLDITTDMNRLLGDIGKLCVFTLKLFFFLVQQSCLCAMAHCYKHNRKK